MSLLGIVLFLPLAAGLNFTYHHTNEVEGFLKMMRRNYPSITHLYSIGKSVRGRDLWVLAVGRFPTQHKIGIPEFKYVANMHGDETIGREMLLHLIDLLVTHDQQDPNITRLIDNTRIHIMPSMNPDGFEAVKGFACEPEVGRNNANKVDLNRNFPDAFSKNNITIQPETQAIMNWIKNEIFVLSANLHGGSVVASYPFDNGNAATIVDDYISKTIDDDIFVHLAKTYSKNHATMHNGTPCENGNYFQDGITNGNEWYNLKGGMQDFNYIWGQCFEITLELSCCKYPPENELSAFWMDNKVALVEYIKQVHLGIKGRVINMRGEPLPGVIVETTDRRHICPYRTRQNGEYYLLLLPGEYTLNVTVPERITQLYTITIPNGVENFSAMKYDIVVSATPVRTTLPSCPTEPLYSRDYLPSVSTILKPTVHSLLLINILCACLKNSC
uniref:Carboxypeptidase M n=1 Tax=Salvator merianae TaxID=96440 RepID=A0A8D0DUM9_SALMN